MKRNVVFLLLIIGLIGSLVLVNKNQETRRSAHEADTSLVLTASTTNPMVGEEVTVSIRVNTGVGDSLGAVSLYLPYDKTKMRFERMDMDGLDFFLINDGLPYDPQAPGCVQTNESWNCGSGPGQCECAQRVDEDSTKLRIVVAAKDKSINGQAVEVARVRLMAVGVGQMNLGVLQMLMQINESQEWVPPTGTGVQFTIRPVPTNTPIPTDTPTPTQIPTPTPECTNNSQCPETKYCQIGTGKCNDPVCVPPVDEIMDCKKYVMTNHSCVVMADVAKDKQLCKSGNGRCDGGDCWLKGDANHDGKINLGDFIVWKREFLTSGGLMSDFNADGKISFADFGIWKSEFLKSL